jgi:hypothetical protein
MNRAARRAAAAPFHPRATDADVIAAIAVACGTDN